MASIDARRGEIWLVALGAARRGEPGKTRPAIVVSADELSTGAEDELFVIVPLSSSRAPSPLRPEILPREGIASRSSAICRSVRAVSRTRLLRRIGLVEAETLSEVELALATILGIGRSVAA